MNYNYYPLPPPYAYVPQWYQQNGNQNGSKPQNANGVVGNTQGGGVRAMLNTAKWTIRSPSNAGAVACCSGGREDGSRASEKKRQEKEIAEKKRKIEEAKRAKAAKKKLEEAEKKRQEELAEARRGKAREVVPSQKRIRDDISDPSDPPYQEESMDNDSEQDEEPRAPKKKRKGNNARPIASTLSARPPAQVHCSWNNRIKSNPIVGEASLPTDFCKRIAEAMEGIQESMFGIAYELRQFRLQVGSWEDTLLVERSHRARRGEALEALEIERELEELREEEEEYEKEIMRQEEQSELEEEEE
ncbi:hypothetical protein F5890DRAFT_1559295 [Lentinula detonsa]|uniref:Uncharacterized protein n=1 Tax=Lentinula detonsa TaxID=2804962 RepID=A0AA38PPN6_9AGAR|nr:hypothetical protein F5890DRAFT_1559295 [Lentinula detonsa]